MARRPHLAAILVAPLAAALVLTLFAWPAARLEPRHLPLGVVGERAQPIERGDAFDVHRYASVAAARRAIEDRTIYGAFAAEPTGVRLLTATAASPLVAQLLERERRAPGAVEDVVRASAHDPRGVALAASVLPLVIAGVLTGALATVLAPAPLRRVGLVLAGAVAAGLVATGIAQGWLQVLEGDWVANWAGLSLVVGAIGSVVAGFEALLGRAGIALTAVTMILVGNPFSGVSSAPEMLPKPAGTLGQLLPPGAGGNLLRSTGFFDGAGAGAHIVVLVAWIFVGLVALLGSTVLRGSSLDHEVNTRRAHRVMS